MKKAFFSFFTIALVALVLFMVSSYLFTFKDIQNAAEKDLAGRRVAERMEDARFLLNYSIVDALTDAGYESFKCGAGVYDVNASGFCGNASHLTDWYASNLSVVASDEVFLNITRLSFNCTTDVAARNAPLIADTKVNVTKWVAMTFEIEASTASSRWKEYEFYNISMNLSRSWSDDFEDLSGSSGVNVIVMQRRGLVLNSSNTNETMYVVC